MCGIFGFISSDSRPGSRKNLKYLVAHARQRGRDSSGLIFLEENEYKIHRADYDVIELLGKADPSNSPVILGHSRLITNGLADNQPVVRDNVVLIHNGIVVNDEDVWKKISAERRFNIDSETIAAIAEEHLAETGCIDGVEGKIVSLCKGVIACAIVFPGMGKLMLFSNNGSLYIGEHDAGTYFSSESFPLVEIGCENVRQVINKSVVIDIPAQAAISITDDSSRKEDLIPQFKFIKAEDDLLEYALPDLRRCAKCVLPETMPFIHFDAEGVCNYCKNYAPRNKPKPTEELFNLVEPYRRKEGIDCIVPFSGGRDSCYGLHLVVKELGMKPVAYTYDWGMVTDLGRRNISRMCAELGVENIIVADNISRKRRNIAINLKAWLKSPNLGMVSILTAGDKHFFRHVETIKKQTGINLNLWGVNPLEVTHFKAGFLGVRPYFEEERVYSHGIAKQLRYHYLRTKAMMKSPGYFNRSLWDTLSGEYYRSFTEKNDYYHIFDYWRWDEKLVDETLINQYEWETAIDTNATWRIGDGTAAFYNYVYYTVAGFTEHDTFRSNQIREGDLTRQEALEFVQDENRPRYQNIRWYLDTLGMDFTEVIRTVNAIPKIYKDFPKVSAYRPA